MSAQHVKANGPRSESFQSCLIVDVYIMCVISLNNV